MVRHDGQSQTAAPGLLAAPPPRRPARPRTGDQLLLHLTISGGAVFAPEEQARWLEKLHQTYYKTDGSVTSAIRRVVEQFNQALLERNLNLSGRTPPGVGLLSVAVLRPERMYLAQSGPVHAILAAGGETRQYHDPALAGRGLGLSRTTTLRYLQFELQPGDLLLLSGQPSPAWTPAVLGAARAQSLGLEALRRELTAQIQVDALALLVQVRPGTGRLRLARPRPVGAESLTGAESESDRLAGEPYTAAPAVEVAVEPQADAAPAWQAAPEPPSSVEVEFEDIQPEPQPVEPQAEQPVQAEPIRTPRWQRPGWRGPFGASDEAPAAAESAAAPGMAAAPAAAQVDEPVPVRPRRSAPRLSPGVAGGLLKAGAALSSTRQRLGETFRTWGERLLPEEAPSELPSSLMLFIAVAVPLIVVAIASTFYFQRGRGSQYDTYLAQASGYAVQASAAPDLESRRQAYRQALSTLAQAERINETDETRALRAQLMGQLDELDAIERLDFQPAIIGGLSEAISITQMVATSEDLYLLNGAQGNVLHAELTGQGYRMDTAFTCGQTPNTGPLVDIAALPVGSPAKAEIVGIDANGSLLYCQSNQAPRSRVLATPDSNWGRPTAIVVQDGALYLLDPLTNAVWIYGSEDNDDSFDQRPRFYFASQVPNLRAAVDLAVFGNELYILHADSHLTWCTYSLLAESPTRCDDPTLLTDIRVGRSSGPVLADTAFSSLLYTPPPDPSIYLLDATDQAVYHFSLRMTLQRQFQANTALAAGQARAFAISPTRTLFLAVGNRVYYATMR